MLISGKRGAPTAPLSSGGNRFYAAYCHPFGNRHSLAFSSPSFAEGDPGGGGGDPPPAKTYQDGLTEGFRKGYNEGKVKGSREILGKISFLEVDENDLDGSIQRAREAFTAFKEGKLTGEMKKKIKDMDAFKEMEKKLQQKEDAYQRLQQEKEQFIRQTLIDSRLQQLAAENKAIDAQDVVLAFKNAYKLDITEDNKPVVRTVEGHPIFNNETGDELKLEDVFDQFKLRKKHLFAGSDNGGSGGGPDGPPANVSLKDLKNVEAKTKYIKEHGFESYQKLVIAEAEKGNSNE